MKQITVSWGRPIPKMRGLMAYMRILHMSDTDHRQNKKKILELLDEVGCLARPLPCDLQNRSSSLHL